MRRRGFALALLVALVPALAWLLWPARRETTAPVQAPVPAEPSPPASATPPPQAPSPQAPGVASSVPRAASAEPPPLPDHLRREPRLSKVLDELLRRAESGDVAAMQALGSRLTQCSDVALRHLRRQLREDIAQLTDQETPAAANARRQVDNLRNTIADCEALPADLRDSGLDWMERAAATGSGAAQVEYVEFAFGSFMSLDEDEVVAQIEDFRRRRDLARRFADEALAHCAPRAEFIRYYWANLLLDQRDPRAYAIEVATAVDALARDDVARGAPASTVQERQRTFDSLLQKFDEAARAEARRRGEAQFNACAGH
ncbi:MAG TPA: hypothetical protein VM847_06975 [Tahibacter sp.]|nr:hypothetical protein [Tahibacter sp.]